MNPLRQVLEYVMLFSDYAKVAAEKAEACEKKQLAKRLDALSCKLDDFASSAAFYCYVDNIHKYPKIRDFLCKIGRHDYEFDRATSDHSAMLTCFYCERQRHSSMSKG